MLHAACSGPCDHDYSQWGNMCLLPTEVYLKPSQKSPIKLFFKNSSWLKAFNYFCKSLVEDVRLGSQYAPVLSLF